MEIKDIIIWILFIATLIFIFWWIFGNSPTFEQTVLILILTLLFTIGANVSKNGIKMNFIEKRFNKLENSFIKLSEDFEEHVK